MSFKSLEHLLTSYRTQSSFAQQPFQLCLQHWSDVVGKAVALHTRPVSLQRDVLRVATSSAAWAQTLTFERHRILQKLNPYLPTPLVDIRFAGAGWERPRAQTTTASPTSEHPSAIALPRPKIPQPTQETPNAAFSHWASVVRSRDRHLPLCPLCQCSTPPGELQRWQMCAFCAAKQW